MIKFIVFVFALAITVVCQQWPLIPGIITTLGYAFIIFCCSFALFAGSVFGERISYFRFKVLISWIIIGILLTIYQSFVLMYLDDRKLLLGEIFLFNVLMSWAYLYKGFLFVDDKINGQQPIFG